MIWTVGLTGGIGSGKTAAAERFRTRGAAIVDTDVIAHELTRSSGLAIDPIRQAFGPGLITPEGAINRSAMRKRIFADPTAKARLEAILHPLIRAECEAGLRRLASADRGPDYAILVIPLLVETGGWRPPLHRVCVVDCPEELQVERTMARSGLTRPEINAIMDTQARRQTRLAAADDIIDNSAGLVELYAQVDKLHETYRRQAQPV